MTLAITTELISFLLLTYISVSSLRLLRSPRTSPIPILNFQLLVVYAFPWVIEALSGTPDFGAVVNYQYVASETSLRTLSALGICAAPVIWTHTATRGLLTTRTTTTETGLLSLITNSMHVKLLLAFAALSPIVLIAFAPDIQIYMTYGPILPKVGRQAIHELSFHAYLNQFIRYSMLSCFALIVLIFNGASRYKWILFLTLISILGIDCFLHGKRSSFALAICGVGFSLWFSGAISRKLLIVLGLSTITVLPLLSYQYQQYSGRSRNTEWVDIYREIRIDFFRDSAHKLSLASIGLGPKNVKILDYYGESLFIYGTLPIPRAWWPEKPVSYGMSLACAALNIKRQYLGWGLTSSLLDESIANFSLLGVFIGPILIGLILRQSVRFNDPIIALLTTVLCGLLVMVHLSSCAPMLICWLFAIVLSRKSSRLRQLL